MKVTTRKLPDHYRCPHCGEQLDAVTGAADDELDTIPTTGAITVCAYCATLLTFGEDQMQLASAAQLADLDPWALDVMSEVCGQEVVARG